MALYAEMLNEQPTVSSQLTIRVSTPNAIFSKLSLPARLFAERAADQQNGGALNMEHGQIRMRVTAAFHRPLAALDAAKKLMELSLGCR